MSLIEYGRRDLVIDRFRFGYLIDKPNPTTAAWSEPHPLVDRLWSCRIGWPDVPQAEPVRGGLPQWSRHTGGVDRLCRGDLPDGDGAFGVAWFAPRGLCGALVVGEAVAAADVEEEVDVALEVGGRLPPRRLRRTSGSRD